MLARSRTAVAALAASAVIGLLGGCSTSVSNKAITDYKGEPKGVEAPPSSAGGAPFSVWLKGGTQFTVTLYGSSSCPPTGEYYTLTGNNQLTVRVAEQPKNKACTADYAPHTTVFATAKAIDPHSSVKITVQNIRFTLLPLTK